MCDLAKKSEPDPSPSAVVATRDEILPRAGGNVLPPLPFFSTLSCKEARHGAANWRHQDPLQPEVIGTTEFWVHK